MRNLGGILRKIFSWCMHWCDATHRAEKARDEWGTRDLWVDGAPGTLALEQSSRTLDIFFGVHVEGERFGWHRPRAAQQVASAGVAH
jgi:hypothetical protein